MTRPRAALACLLAAAVPLASGCGSGEIDDPALEETIQDIRQATEKYRDPRVAQRDGYRPTPRCSESPDEGGIGITFVNRALSRDNEVDLLRPEQLLYEPGRGGERTLVGVGYFVPSTGQRPPETPIGHLDGPIPERFEGQGEHFALQAWVHRENPNGVFDTWNPDVSC